MTSWRVIRAQSQSARKASLAPALVCVSLITLASFIGIALLSRPTKKRVAIQARCDQVQFSQGIVLNPDTSVEDIQLTNFRGSIAHIDTLAQPERSRPTTFTTEATLVLEGARDDRTGAPPSLRLKRTGPQAPMTVQTSSSTSIRTRDPLRDGGDVVEIQVGRGSAFVAQAKQYHLEAARYHLHIRSGGSVVKVPPDAPLDVASATLLMQATLQTPASGGEDVGTLVLHYPPGTPAVNLLDRSMPTGAVLNGELGLLGCGRMLLQIEDSNDVAIRDVKNDVKMQAVAFSLRRLSVTDRSVEGRRAVEIAGSGLSPSIFQEQRQLIPTFLVDVFSRKPYEVGLIGATIIFGVFTGGVFLKRSLEVIAKRLIPD